MIRLVLAAAIALAWSPPAHAYRLPWCGFYMMHYFGKVDPRLANCLYRLLSAASTIQG